jgi:hypothetical protein
MIGGKIRYIFLVMVVKVAVGVVWGEGGSDSYLH